MVFDTIENASLYFCLSERLKKGLKYLLDTDFTTVETGKYEIDGDKIFAIVNKYDSKPEEACKLESHLKYIDIQYVVEGNEKMGYVAKAAQVPTIAYSSEKDVMFYKEEDVNFLAFDKDKFAIFYPSDLHQPGVTDGAVSKVYKVVVKVAI